MPVSKLGTLFGLNRFGGAIYLLSVMAGGLSVAAVSWFLIERPALT